MFYDAVGNFCLDSDDQCHRCIHSDPLDPETICPLMEALVVGIVTLDGEPLTKACRWFRPRGGHLKVV